MLNGPVINEHLKDWLWEVSDQWTQCRSQHGRLLPWTKFAVKWFNWIWILLDHRQQKLWEITKSVISLKKISSPMRMSSVVGWNKENHVEMKMSIQSKEKPWDLKLKGIWNQAAEQFPLHYITTPVSSRHCLKERTSMKKSLRHKITLLSSFKIPWILTLLAYLELLCAFLSIIP